MELLIFGHAGARVLVFPTSLGRFYEWEDHGMVAELGEHLERGWIRLYCVDSVDEESWYAGWKWPGDRAWRHEQYDRYLTDEVLPLTLHRDPNPFLITTGASFGAYHAVNFAFRHPWLVGRTIGMSGLYDIRRFVRGHYDENVYRNNPAHYVSEVQDAGWLDAMRRMDIVLATGEGDAFVDNNRYLSGALWSRGIGNALRIWDGWAHDWPWWKRMIRAYIGGSD
jgi:esterase/lipase superfamily enzyme